MITLITGTPGSGKTAWIVNELSKLSQGRSIYVHAIPDLTVPHIDVFCRSELCDFCTNYGFAVVPAPLYNSEGQLVNGDEITYKTTEQESYRFVEYWQDWAPDGALLIIDEVQRVWRPRGSASNLPESVAKLETHRHRGLDFWLVSQNPSLFDYNIRQLVGRHIHLVVHWKGRMEYEWPECHQNTSSRADAIKRPYRLPKSIFSSYKSATIHTQLLKRKPLSFYAFFILLAVAAFLGWHIKNRVNERMNPEKPIEQATGGGERLWSAPTPAPMNVNKDNGKSAHEQVIDFTPRVPLRPETAPAYDGLLKVSAVPRLAGCIQSEDECKCYTVQATPYPASVEYCKAFIKNDVFNPYKPELLPSVKDDA